MFRSFLATVPLNRSVDAHPLSFPVPPDNLLRPRSSPALLLLSFVLSGTVSVDRFRRGYAASGAQPEHGAKETLEPGKREKIGEREKKSTRRGKRERSWVRQRKSESTRVRAREIKWRRVKAVTNPTRMHSDRNREGLKKAGGTRLKQGATETSGWCSEKDEQRRGGEKKRGTPRRKRDRKIKGLRERAGLARGGQTERENPKEIEMRTLRRGEGETGEEKRRRRVVPGFQLSAYGGKDAGSVAFSGLFLCVCIPPFYPLPLLFSSLFSHPPVPLFSTFFFICLFLLRTRKTNLSSPHGGIWLYGYTTDVYRYKRYRYY